jgi:hypothetical protein
MKLKGTMRVSHLQGFNEDTTPIHIEINDAASGCRVLDVYLAYDEFSKALTSSQGEATIEIRNLTNIGKKLESHECLVPFQFSNDSEKDIDAALKPFEVDGWKAWRSDMTNHHNGGNGMQRVRFFRYVEIKE